MIVTDIPPPRSENWWFYGNLAVFITKNFYPYWNLKKINWSMKKIIVKASLKTIFNYYNFNHLPADTIKPFLSSKIHFLFSTTNSKSVLFEVFLWSEFIFLFSPWPGLVEKIKESVLYKLGFSLLPGNGLISAARVWCGSPERFRKDRSSWELVEFIWRLNLRWQGWALWSSQFRWNASLPKVLSHYKCYSISHFQK